MISLTEDAVRNKVLEVLNYCENNYKGLQEPEGKIDSDGNIPGYYLIAKYGDIDDFGEDTRFYRIFRRLLLQGWFSDEEVSRMKKITNPDREEIYDINDMLAFALDATHKRSVVTRTSFEVYYYKKLSDEELEFEKELEKTPKINCSDL